MRFGDRHAGLRHVVAREVVEIGGLLVGAAPVRQCRRDTAGSQDRQRQTHVAVGQRLGHQGVGDRGAVLGDTVEILGDVDRGDPEFGGLGDQIRGIGRRLVGVVGGRAQNLLGELVDRRDDHLLVVVGGEVEIVGATWPQPRRRLADALDFLELPGGRAGSRERLLDTVFQAAVERIAQVVAVQEVLADQRCDDRQSDIGDGSLVLELPDRAVAGPGAR